MAHFAKLDDDNTVLAVHVVNNDVLDPSNTGSEDESLGITFLSNVHGWVKWKQTSYNTNGGVHTLGGTPFRKNYASIGFTYDESKDAFIPPKPFSSWILNETTCLWEAPVAYPTVLEYGDPVEYYQPTWDEPNGKWIDDQLNLSWDPGTSAWV